MSGVCIWVVIPAAGMGRRFGGDVPKQYMTLSGRPVIEHTLARFAGMPRIAGVVVALDAEDKRFGTVVRPDELAVSTVTGGEERMHSVLSATAWLLAGGEATPADWVLVHDAVRPLLLREDLERLIKTCDEGAEGALLGTPVADTLKRAGEAGQVEDTLGRERLWRAFTPQMFKLGALHEALVSARDAGLHLTDEAMAMERMGITPRLVPGDSCNIKITRPQDLKLAEAWLAAEVT